MTEYTGTGEGGEGRGGGGRVEGGREKENKNGVKGWKRERVGGKERRGERGGGMENED